MQHLQLTLDAPAANLALDEALLEAAEADQLGETLRLWEPTEDFIVLGRSSELREVHRPACQRDGVALYRRSSGGGVVVAGPGCLMYSVVLSLARLPDPRNIDAAHRYVLERVAAAVGQAFRKRPQLESHANAVHRAGVSDLVLQSPDDAAPRKFSGNSLRLKRRYLLYHGTLLYDFELAKITRWLDAPKRTPDYRQLRNHREFVTNLGLPAPALVDALLQQWEAKTPLTTWPRARTQQLARENYQMLA